ncbi:hypothetical protein KIPB_009160, partial [Kipferlia bialata]
EEYLAMVRAEADRLAMCPRESAPTPPAAMTPEAEDESMPDAQESVVVIEHDSERSFYMHPTVEWERSIMQWWVTLRAQTHSSLNALPDRVEPEVPLSILMRPLALTALPGLSRSFCLQVVEEITPLLLTVSAKGVDKLLRWVFGMLLLVETPLTRDEQASVYGLLGSLASLRLRLAEMQPSKERDAGLALACVLSTVMGRYFEQCDTDLMYPRD